MPGTIISRTFSRRTTRNTRCNPVDAGSDSGSSWLGGSMSYSPESMPVGELYPESSAYSLSPLLVDNASLCNFGDQPGTVYYDTRTSARPAWNQAPSPLTDKPSVPARTWYNVGPDYGTIYYDSRESRQYASNAQTSTSTLGLTGMQAPPSFQSCYGPARGTAYYDSRTSLQNQNERYSGYTTPRTPSKSFASCYGHTERTVYYDSRVSLPQRMTEVYTPDPDVVTRNSPLTGPTLTFTPVFDLPKRQACSLDDSPVHKIQKPRFHLTK